MRDLGITFNESANARLINRKIKLSNRSRATMAELGVKTDRKIMSSNRSNSCFRDIGVKPNESGKLERFKLGRAKSGRIERFNSGRYRRKTKRKRKRPIS